MHTHAGETRGLQRTLHPQESWEWPIAVYLYLAGLGAGALAVGLLTDWIVKPEGLPTKAILLWGPIFVALGAPFLILDLGKKMRFLNACLNPMSSWAARGFLILSTLIITGLITFGVPFLTWALPIVGLDTPTWLNPDLAIFRALSIVAIVFAFGTAAYTGVFLKSVRYVSLWNTWLLPVLFLVSALSTGSMGIIVSLVGFGELTHNEALIGLSHSLAPVEQVLVIVEAIVLAAFIIMRNRAAGAAPLSVRLLLRGKMKLFFWVGIVVMGMLLPTVLENIYARLPDYPALIFIGGASLLIGGFFLRFAIVKGGLKDEHPLQKIVAAQYDWNTLANCETAAFESHEVRDA